MTALSTIGRAGRAAMMTLILSTPALTTVAYAFDPLSGGDPAVPSAESAHYANPNDTPLARATAAAKAAASAYAADRSSVASDASQAGSADLVGQGGPQDDLAREIYHPGTGTDW